MSFTLESCAYNAFTPNRDAVVFLYRDDDDLNILESDMKAHFLTLKPVFPVKEKTFSQVYYDFGQGMQLVVFYRLPESVDYVVLRESIAAAYLALDVTKRSDISLFIPGFCFDFSESLLGQLIGEALLLSSYVYPKKGENESALKSLNVTCPEDQSTSFLEGLRSGLLIGEAVCLVRTLANKPSNLLTPKAVVDWASSVFKDLPVEVDVIDEAQAASLGMEAFLGVGRGSAEASYLLCLRYRVKEGSRPIALVGKGITFDSGGISIKPSKSMSEMKADMSGAATVLGALYAAANLQIDMPVLALIPLAENMPSGDAQKPGDVVTAMNGKTIEILNTDAEGRLVMADALCYAVQQQVSCIVDVATLTGSCVVALGQRAAGLFSNDETLIKKFQTISSFTGERVWHLPLYDDYLDDLKSSVADISNCCESRYGGACTAAKFLEQFVDKVPWVHLDIAPVMRLTDRTSLGKKGMAAEGTRNLIALLQALALDAT